MTDEDFDFGTWRRGQVYYTADLHLGHDRIIKYCNRPFQTVEEMNQTIIKNINTTLTIYDTLVILGDLALGRLHDTLTLLGQIHATRIWVIPGNHDRFSLAYGHHGSPEVVMSKRRLWRHEYEQHSRRTIRCEPDREPSAWKIHVGGRPVLLSHYPYRGDSGDRDRYGWLRPAWGGLPLIHGHVHSKWQTRGPMFNVGVDVNGFYPVSEGELVHWLMGIPVGGVGDVGGQVGLA